MRRLLRVAFILVFLAGFSGRTFSQSDTTRKDTLNYYDMTIEQLLNLKAHGVPTELEKLINSLISVASKKPLSTRESPSIVSLITADEIKTSGARDLIDVLRMVPGIDFGADVLGVVGIGMRGNWAHEGKVLLLIDGQEMNEILYATTQFGNHYPVDLIKKIEIIRGPGSAIYGGYAEYGVINIITKQGEDLNGISVSAINGGNQKNDNLRSNISLAAGQKKGDLQYSVSGMIGQAQRSDQNYTDVNGTTYNMLGNSALNPAFANVGVSYKGLSFRGIGDFYHMTIRDGNSTAMSATQDQYFNSYYGELKYNWKISDKLSITPKLNYKNQSPWKTPVADTFNGTVLNSAYLKSATRSTANITASYSPTRKINLVAGGEIYQDVAVDRLIYNSVQDTFYNGKTRVSFYNFAFFTQGLVKTRLVNIILGARYDKHNVYGDAFVPRVGLTKKYNRFHFKALFSNSFRAPAIENINYSVGTGILPERTQVAELELGYQITHKSIFTVNFFDITTRHPIVYYYNTNIGSDAYLNGTSTGTTGLEAEYKIRAKWGYISANYSFYTAAGKSQIPAYKVTVDSTKLLGFAGHKFNLACNVNITKKLSVNLNESFYGARYGGVSFNQADSTTQFKKFDPVMLMNVFLRYTPVKGLSIGVGVYDLLDQRFVFIQPYTDSKRAGHAPLPAAGREFIFRISYDLSFKSKKTQ